MIGLKGTLNVRLSLSPFSNKFPSSNESTGHRQLGRTARRVRQRAQK
jgi:hypothetical protein